MVFVGFLWYGMVWYDGSSGSRLWHSFRVACALISDEEAAAAAADVRLPTDNKPETGGRGDPKRGQRRGPVM